MPVKDRARHILAELKGHAPFTLFGAVLGVVFIVLFGGVRERFGHVFFVVFHPAHVVLSAMVTASMFKLHAGKRRLVLILVIGYFGSIGIATMSDIVIPHIGSRLLGLDIPTHGEIHHAGGGEDVEDAGHEHGDHGEHGGREIHLAFIEEWYLVNPAAFLGIAIALLIPRTKFPHAGHVLISTCASLSYLLMGMRSELTIVAGVGILATLFVATWVPCCVSDIIFPLLFVNSDIELSYECSKHDVHSHPHRRKGAKEES